MISGATAVRSVSPTDPPGTSRSDARTEFPADPLPDREEIDSFVASCRKSGENVVGHGYQGRVYLFDDGRRKFVVKSPDGRGVRAAIRRFMLRKEHDCYAKLAGVEGIPRCLGLVEGKHLLLEYVPGVPYRQAKIEDRPRFFEGLLALIEAVHARGVAHGDLKKKDNLLVVDGCEPCMIDFGVAVVRKRRFAPLNWYWFALARRFDLNAWAKLKYGAKLRGISDRDRSYVNRTVVERTARRIKSLYLSLRGRG